MANRYQDRGRGGRGQSDERGSGGPIDMREEDFARPASQQTEQMCSNCHNEPVLRMTVVSGGRTYENLFYGDAASRSNPLGDRCAREKAIAIIRAEAGRIEHVIEVMTDDLPEYDASRIEMTVGDKLAEIEEQLLPESRYSEAIFAVRSLRRTTNLRCAEPLIIAARKRLEAFRDNPDGAALYEHAGQLDKKRVGMMPNPEGFFPRVDDGGASPSYDEYAVFQDAQRLCKQAASIGEQQERRESIRSEVSGMFSSRFRRSQPAATSEQSEDVPQPTIGDAVSDDAKAALASIGNGEPNEVPSALSNDAPAADDPADESDDAATDASTPAAIEHNA